MKTLTDVFLDELAVIYDAQQCLVSVLPKMAKAASSLHLREALNSHLKATEGQVTKLEGVFGCFDIRPIAETCQATAGPLGIPHSSKWARDTNKALIAAQKVEHYTMASYGCLHEWAGILGNTEATGLLEEIMEDGKAANTALTQWANTRSDPQAMGARAFAEPARPAIAY